MVQAREQHRRDQETLFRAINAESWPDPPISGSRSERIRSLRGHCREALRRVPEAFGSDEVLFWRAVKEDFRDSELSRDPGRFTEEGARERFLEIWAKWYSDYQRRAEAIRRESRGLDPLEAEFELQDAKDAQMLRSVPLNLLRALDLYDDAEDLPESPRRACLLQMLESEIVLLDEGVPAGDLLDHCAQSLVVLREMSAESVSFTG